MVGLSLPTMLGFSVVGVTTTGFWALTGVVVTFGVSTVLRGALLPVPNRVAVLVSTVMPVTTGVDAVAVSCLINTGGFTVGVSLPVVPAWVVPPVALSPFAPGKIFAAFSSCFFLNMKRKKAPAIISINKIFLLSIVW